MILEDLNLVALPWPAGCGAASIKGCSARITADSAASTNDRPTGNRRSSDVWLKNTRLGDAIAHSVPVTAGMMTAPSAVECPRRGDGRKGA